MQRKNEEKKSQRSWKISLRRRGLAWIRNVCVWGKKKKGQGVKENKIGNVKSSMKFLF